MAEDADTTFTGIVTQHLRLADHRPTGNFKREPLTSDSMFERLIQPAKEGKERTFVIESQEVQLRTRLDKNFELRETWVGITRVIIPFKVFVAMAYAEAPASDEEKTRGRFNSLVYVPEWAWMERLKNPLPFPVALAALLGQDRDSLNNTEYSVALYWRIVHRFSKGKP